MKVLGLAAYPAQAASTRFRMSQYREMLQVRGIDLKIITFLDDAAFKAIYSGASSVLKLAHLTRCAALHTLRITTLRTPDILWVQREATLIGPEIAETWASRFHRVPMVLD